MKETLILGNHPETLALAYPVLDLIRQYPNTSLVSGEFWKLLSFAITIIPVDLGRSSAYPDVRKFPGFERKVLNFFEQFGQLPPNSANPVADIVQTLEHGRNVIIFPAGATPKNKQERPWRRGTAVAIQQAQQRVPDLQLAFLRVRNPLNYTLTAPVPVQEVFRGTPMTDAAQSIQHLRQYYDGLWEKH